MVLVRNKPQITLWRFCKLYFDQSLSEIILRFCTASKYIIILMITPGDQQTDQDLNDYCHLKESAPYKCKTIKGNKFPIWPITARFFLFFLNP